MIRPEGFRGAAFGSAADGDARNEPAARVAMAAELRISPDWASLSQVHGDMVIEAKEPGELGPGDGVFSAVPGLPMIVATADCLPIIIEGRSVAGVIHAGWRGLDSGIIGATLEAIERAGLMAERAAIGPAIGPCCYEVGDEVAGRFGGFISRTDAGTTSVDLGAVAAAQLGGLATFRSPDCTMCGSGYNSYRRDETDIRQVAVAWLPAD